ncbi:MAG: prepilin-type N-terminal cleavage/methylation domain-containing protein [Opitutaceae bacterium]|jgi:prepilin-type processing-associated H-X9-DG protein|nr:prepilin-type N-terminal cleavage/methylation domain-containing protein [Opitutaceae bacterium]
MRTRKVVAFTLAELLVVIAITGVLADIMIVTVSRIRISAQKAKAISDIRQIGMSLFSYTDDHKGTGLAVWNGPANKSWLRVLVEEGYLQDPAWRLENGAWINPDKRLASLFNPVSRSRYPTANNTGGFGLNMFANVFNLPKIHALSRPSLTVLLADAYIKPDGNDFNFDMAVSCDSFQPNTETGGGANYLFCDGHVKWIRAQDPSQRNSPPLGAKQTVFFWE